MVKVCLLLGSKGKGWDNQICESVWFCLLGPGHIVHAFMIRSPILAMNMNSKANNEEAIMCMAHVVSL